MKEVCKTWCLGEAHFGYRFGGLYPLPAHALAWMTFPGYLLGSLHFRKLELWSGDVPMEFAFDKRVKGSFGLR